MKHILVSDDLHQALRLRAIHERTSIKEAAASILSKGLNND